MDPLIKEVLPEERLAKVFQVLALHHNINDMTISDVAALLSPYMQLELEDKGHQERVLCLSDFYNLRERLMQRERDSFKKKSELLLQIVSRPEAKSLGIHVYEKDLGTGA